ncbi:DUF4097 family beta strand repeat-containing protein [Terribacillus saccharophilus]|uniref:Adhesin n=1 Tax=Terribacillus saccharophilus TaxID=361277 RepID=A0AAX2EII5_9BACI|nr:MULTISPECIES: DUF4097 family beta strand repeat-containing protein [Terribacillus]MCM3225899.1 DUF4097 domain-containing protein [Terribacillus saccharophilus]MEC0282615.1 DUF4097 family beta strand repeat-containing protein [Terribacillus saccharophilus]MEC0291817.1 DUF4097 family beta strand repeat-containing protein [Terribacillus saccharophilus]SEN87131.1 Putative adhesin [Terribacillus saccharophilus]
MKIRYLLSLCFVIILCGCQTTPNEDYRQLSVESVEKIHLDFGSTDTSVIQTDSSELEIILHLDDNGPGLKVEAERGSIFVSLGSDIRRLFSRDKPKLELRIPESYLGRLIFEGSSGNLDVENLHIKGLAIDSSSGNLTLNALAVQGDISIKTTSGAVHLGIQEVEPNALFRLSSNSGRRAITYPLMDRNETKKMTTGKSGSGDYRVAIDTASGNISVN